MSEVLPCMTCPARTTPPPKTCPMHWCPRHTPRTGRRPAEEPMTSVDTPAMASSVKVSPMWVPILMFALLGIGTLVILINYTDTLWGTSNWYLLAGLASILGGIITATQYH